MSEKYWIWSRKIHLVYTIEDGTWRTVCHSNVDVTPGMLTPLMSTWDPEKMCQRCTRTMT